MTPWRWSTGGASNRWRRELAAVLSARYRGTQVEVAGAADGAEVTIERARGLHRFRVGEDVESSPLLRYLLLGYVSPPKQLQPVLLRLGNLEPATVPTTRAVA
jgi:hypothetical protein